MNERDGSLLFRRWHSSGIGGGFSLFFNNRSQARRRTTRPAQQRAEAAAGRRQRAERSHRRDALAKSSSPRSAASRAQIISRRSCRPDLLRFNLVATEEANRASAQLLFSRSRGMVFSGSRLSSLGTGRCIKSGC